MYCLNTCIAHQVIKMHQSAVILLLVLCASLSTDAQPADVRQRYEKFLRQHVYGKMNERICDSEIRKRQITLSDTDNGCKEVNTFIQANGNTVRAVCTGGGTIYNKQRNLYISNNPFPVITCKLTGGTRRPNCVYRGHKSTRKIVVACEQGWPTHYDEGILNN
ncbi:ribonuclease-like 3 [Misgurnus anguillicaudatus]|uniref:ribonuclease-like 3 n=1 Tax=Misgurnus anguillicaudatus TaxID=75329 RepID=UPI003CCF4170